MLFYASSHISEHCVTTVGIPFFIDASVSRDLKSSRACLTKSSHLVVRGSFVRALPTWQQCLSVCVCLSVGWKLELKNDEIHDEAVTE